jgi:hypothetical protein
MSEEELLEKIIELIAQWKADHFSIDNVYKSDIAKLLKQRQATGLFDDLIAIHVRYKQNDTDDVCQIVRVFYEETHNVREFRSKSNFKRFTLPYVIRENLLKSSNKEIEYSLKFT